jgi:biopolymer transport protein ExbB/TolQ
MNFDPTVTWGAVLLGSSYVVAAVIFVVTMRPQIKSLTDSNKSLNEWKEEHEKAAAKRDLAISKLAQASSFRLDNLENENKGADRWRELHEQTARERDKSINDLALEVTKVVSLQKNSEEHMGRLDKLFELFVEKLADSRKNVSLGYKNE